MVKLRPNARRPYQTHAKVSDPIVHGTDEVIRKKGRLAEQYLEINRTNKLPSPNPFGALNQRVFA